MAQKQTLELPLNWRELERLAESLARLCVGQFVDRLWVPERRWASGGFLRDEWCLRIGKLTLWVSLRAGRPFVGATAEPLPKAARTATLSPFLQLLAKQAPGLKVSAVCSTPRERAIRFEFAGGHALALHLRAQAPEAFWLARGSLPDRWNLLASSREAAVATDARYIEPDGRGAPEAPPLRQPERLADPTLLCRTYAQWLERELLAERWKYVHAQVEQTRRQAHERSQPHANSGAPGALPASARTRARAQALETQSWTQPIEPKESARLRREAARLYAQAKREEARELDPAERTRRLSERALTLAEWQTRYPHDRELTAEQLEAALAELEGLGLSVDALLGSATVERVSPALRDWHGRSYRSQEGLPILVGRSAEDNRVLLTRIARGNDVWLHIKGRPGSHAVIVLPKDRSASLDTLLDAALLVVVHSGGSQWGRVEVDYTFRKHVKRIPKSTQVTYSQNRTLVVDAQSADGQARLARLTLADKLT